MDILYRVGWSTLDCAHYPIVMLTAAQIFYWAWPRLTPNTCTTSAPISAKTLWGHRQFLQMNAQMDLSFEGWETSMVKLHHQGKKNINDIIKVGLDQRSQSLTLSSAKTNYSLRCTLHLRSGNLEMFSATRINIRAAFRWSLRFTWFFTRRYEWRITRLFSISAGTLMWRFFSSLSILSKYLGSVKGKSWLLFLNCQVPSLHLQTQGTNICCKFFREKWKEPR